MLKCHLEAADMWRKPHCIKTVVRQDSQGRSAEYKANIVYRRKKIPCFLAVCKQDQGVCLWRELFANRKPLPVIQEAVLMHNRCSAELSKESSNWKDIFLEHCGLTEDKQVSRCVGSSRKIDYCAGTSQRFEPWNVCYPGVVQ